MIVEIVAGLNSLKAAGDIVKGLNAVATQAAINDAKLTLQAHIFDARESLAAAQESEAATLKRVAELEQEIMRLKDWEAEKQTYQLQAIWRGTYAYVRKPGMENGEPPHWLCANCFGKGHKQFLQFRGQDREPNGARGTTLSYGCDNCKSTVKVSLNVSPSSPWIAPVGV